MRNAMRQAPRMGLVLGLGLLVGACASTPTAGANVRPEVAYSVRPEIPPPVTPTAAEAAPAVIQDDVRTATPAQPEWTFTASLYLWLAHKRGVIETGNIGIPLDDPDESAGVFLYLEGERGQWGFIADLDLLESEDETKIATGTIEVDEDTLIGEADVTYRLESEPTLQFLAGLRFLDSTQDINFPILPDVSTDLTQIDPILGAQGTWQVGEQFMFRLRGDIGGFGLDSDFTYQMLGVFGWEFAQRWRLTAGYRILGWEYDVDDVDNDLRLQGALLGVAATF